MRPCDRLRLRRYFAGHVKLYSQVYSGKAGPLARRWWRPLLELHQHTLEALADLRERHVLEIGCGTGHLATAMALRGATVLGLDITPEMIDSARTHATAAGLEHRVRFEVADFDEWQPAANTTFDVVVALGVMDYCADPRRWFGRVHALGGKLIATFPGSVLPLKAVRVLNQFLQQGAPLRFYHKAEVKQLLADSRFTVDSFATLGPTFWVRATPR